MRFYSSLWTESWLFWCTGLLRPDIMRLRLKSFYPQEPLSQPANHGSVFMDQVQLKVGFLLRLTALMPVMNTQLNGRNVSTGKLPQFWPTSRLVHWLPRLTAKQISWPSDGFFQLTSRIISMLPVKTTLDSYFDQDVASMAYLLPGWFAMLLNLFCPRRCLGSQFKCDLDNRCSFSFLTWVRCRWAPASGFRSCRADSSLIHLQQFFNRFYYCGLINFKLFYGSIFKLIPLITNKVPVRVLEDFWDLWQSIWYHAWLISGKQINVLK